VKKFRIALLSIFLILGLCICTPSNAAIRTGSTCAPLRSAQVSAGVKFTCVQAGSKTVWNSGARCTSVGEIYSIAAKNYQCETVAGKNVLTQTSYLWADEFNANSGPPASTKWSPSYGTGWPLYGWGNNELESYEDYANRLDGNGSLVITATRSKPLNAANSGVMSQWVSGKITTASHASFLYGKLEARIQVPAGAGTWPAFWMLGAQYPAVPWPWSGEIDILEAKGSQSSLLWQTGHGPAGGGAEANLPTSNVHDTGVTLSNDYHTYGILWQPNQLQWTFDGQVVSTITSTQWAAISSADWPFNHAYYAILNLAMGGDFAGGVSGSLSSAQMKVDWVHYSKYNGYGKVTLIK